MQNTDDLRIRDIDPLMPPVLLEKSLPLSESSANLVASTRSQAADIMAGRDPRVLVIVGPCSIHDPEAAMDYGQRLRGITPGLSDALCLLMRVYFEKPRTTIGWKGLINDPDLDESYNINKGLHTGRKLLLDLANISIPSGTEFLDTISPQYIADLVSWGAIGARTTESQNHRQLASGLSMPVGFKNGTGGSIQIAIDAIQSARFPHHFLGVTHQGLSAIVATAGNEDTHLIMRGSSSGPNYEEQHIAAATTMLTKANLPPFLMVDCSHGNSRKDPQQQPLVLNNLASQIQNGNRAIAGVMIESNLVEGAQPLKDKSSLTYGQSITDACVNWDTTVNMLESLASAVRSNRL